MSGFPLCATNVIFLKSITVHLHLQIDWGLSRCHTSCWAKVFVVWWNMESWKVFNHREPSPLGQHEAGRTRFTFNFSFATGRMLWRCSTVEPVTNVPMWFCVEKKINRNLKYLESSHKDLEHTISSMLNLCFLICSVSVRASSQPTSIWVISIKRGVF